MICNSGGGPTLRHSFASSSRDPPVAGEQPGFPFELVLGNTIVGVSYMVQRRFVWANARMGAIFGYSVAELTGQSVRMLYATDHDYVEVGRMYARFSRGDGYVHERPMVRKDGSLIWCLISGRMIDSSDPESPSVWVVQDITSKKQAEEELKRANARLESTVQQRTVNLRRTNETLRHEIESHRAAKLALLESREKYWALFRRIPLGVVVVNDQAQIVEVNGQLTFARTKEELHRIVNDERRAVCGDGAERSLAEVIRNNMPRDGRRAVRFSIRWRDSGGRTRDLQAVGAAIAAYGLGAVFTFEDVTEQRLAREREQEQQLALAHASRLSLVGEMASALVHELGQPLTACQSYLAGMRHRLAKELRDRPDLLTALDRIAAHVDRASEITRNVRGFVARRPASRSRIDVVALVRETLTLIEMRMRLRSGNVRVSVESSEPAIFVVASPLEVQQVLVNLIINALEALGEASTPEPRIVIRLNAGARTAVLIQVVDNGPGVPPELRRRIFDSYFTTKPAGIGMGLMISRSMVEAYGGKLRYLPGRPSGACFQFTLPLVA